jgi:hypothetical protein
LNVKFEPVICAGVFDHFTGDPRKIRVRGAMVHPSPPLSHDLAACYQPPRSHHALILVPRLGLIRPRGMAGSSWPGYALPGDAVYCPALAVAGCGLSPATGPVEVYRWCQPLTGGGR